ncbi:MAG: TIGR03905 family TSCPD domain-containing protein [Oscillospiraceae bacterium]|nr:TIGR03905 family TSCPD domain-containing protein [Oscillospiraceae bacterium]
MEYRYRTKGTCSRQMIVNLSEDGGTVESARIIGGCNGNTKGICALVQGMKTDEVIQRCKGIRCGLKPTSCPDQLATALEQAKMLCCKSQS